MMNLQYKHEISAYLAATFKAVTPCEAIISGTNGHMRFEKNFWRSESITLVNPDGQEEIYQYPLMTNGYEYEAMHVMECLEKGLMQSDIMSWQASNDLMDMMETLRKSWGIRYPGCLLYTSPSPRD